MLSSIVLFHLAVSGFMFYMAVTTTDRSVLSIPASVVACLLWPIVVPALFIVVQFYPDVPMEEATIVGGRSEEAGTRLLTQE